STQASSITGFDCYQTAVDRFGRKIQKLKIEMLEALKSLSVFFTENSLRTRRNLRGDIERRSLSINEEFVRIFKEVKEELESVHEDVQAMSSCCEEMTNRLKVIIQNHLYQAMESLQDRPVLYKYTLDEFGTARRSAVVRGFIDALTRGGMGGTPRPIEMHSHDPMRYVGDMLAWLHQATASEKEHLEALLKQVTVQGVEENMQEVVGHITEGVCRPLKVRIEQVIIAEPGAVLLYKLSNLLKFYHHTIRSNLFGIMGTSVSSLLMTIDEMHMLSKKMFFNSLSLHASRLMDKVELPPPDLGPTASLTQTLSLLREVLASHDSSVLPLDARQADFAQVLSCILDPLLQLCTVSASNLGTADMATYMVNSLYMMKTTLALFEFTDKRLEMLEFQIEAHLDTLINEQASFVLTRAGLSHIYSCVQQHTAEQGPLANLPGMDSTSLKTSMVQFDRYLASPDTLVMPQLNFLLSAAIKEQIFKQSTELVCRAYGEVYKGVTNPTNAYKDAESVLHRTPQQVQTLLS
uniref:Component of oligomeric golgi complex 6 n=1 Tax=Cyprinus carpio TaxID=7962 RepID=A0A8C1T9Z6_CYPCA